MNKKNENPITDYEISIIKKLLNSDETQDVIPFKIGMYRYFTNNNKALNNGRIKEIKDAKGSLGERASKINEADDIILADFNNIITHGDLKTRLNPFITEHKIIIKARESMISAISSFNNPMFNFGVETFLVLSNIAWTTLLQDILQTRNIDIISKTDKKYLSLDALITKDENNAKLLDKPIKENIKMLITLRDELTHAPNHDIPSDIASYLQANCFNFNKILIKHYGEERGIDNTLAIALQMANFKTFPQVQGLLKDKSKNNFVHIKNIMNKFESELPEEILSNQSFRCNIAVVPMSVNRENQADQVLVVPRDSEYSKTVQSVFYKNIDKAKEYTHTFKSIIENLTKEGFNINKYILTNIIKNKNVKDKREYSYNHNKYIPNKKQLTYSYSEKFIEFLKTQLSKK
jgi:hypothetical protein